MVERQVAKGSDPQPPNFLTSPIHLKMYSCKGKAPLFADDLASAVDDVSRELSAEIYLFAGDILEVAAHQLIDICAMPAKNPNALLILETYGGDADAAYRLIQCLKSRHADGEVSIFIHGKCKSAGTLVTLGADILIMSDHAELGPLDVQIVKPDEINSYYSGLTELKAFAILQSESFKLFEGFLLELLDRSGLRITTLTAAELAATVVSGLMSPIYGQVDPLRLGETLRALDIARLYGDLVKTGNVKWFAVESLVSGYPSHSFVIDRAHARKLFERVLCPSQSQETLASLLAKNRILDPLAKPTTVVGLTGEKSIAKDGETEYGTAEDAQSATGDGATRSVECTETSAGTEDVEASAGQHEGGTCGVPQRPEESEKPD